MTQGAGYDQVDVHACSARDPPIRVSNVPTAVDDATADVNMFLILGALRNFNTGMLALREGKWRGQPAPALGHDPQNKVLGILGMGGIGRNLKKKAEAFDMRVIYHNRRQLSEELADGAKYVTFDELLATSDVLSLNLPLNVRSFPISLPIWSISAFCVKKNFFFFFFFFCLTLCLPEKHSPHHQQAAIRQDEGWHRHRQHRPRRRD